MYGIALDLGTSGYRAQLIDLEREETIKTVITMGHPLPGGNVIDHLDFAIELGEDIANGIILNAVKRIISAFNVNLSEVKKLAICGNPIQLSLFQNMEIRDLAYAGRNKQARLGVEDVKRDSRVVPANDIFGDILDMPNCNVVVPPAIKHEIGADALAMMLKTEFLSQTEPSIVTDYGTNAEMALKVGDKIVTGSAAAGPAIEGQGIGCGMLASPGAITDVNPEGDYWRLTVLDDNMSEKKGDLIEPATGKVVEDSGVKTIGITGTGMISVLSVALDTGLIEKLPQLPNGKIILGDDLVLTNRDIEEAGKAIGAIRAAHLTLIVESGLKYEDLENIYMSGASGTYVDSEKARRLGTCPNFGKRIVQFGNTSISLARDLVFDDNKLDEITEFAHTITADHLMMATSETFKNFYIFELSYWTQGMPIETYNEMLGFYNLPKLPEMVRNPVIEKRVEKDIANVGKEGIETIGNVGIILEEITDGCIFCHKCEEECPEDAITILDTDEGLIANYNAQRCLGTSCRRCVGICPVNAIKYEDVKIKKQ
ncbi:4Fe-4S ferredoxin iron-sulfur binding domain protein [Methanohalobium evestigatum Z-7303]|uniref:4Fe-4S ferredoxin iron-sulfur binding domain protein n=1 Tax=Methanohalobium evestigatum (strain ATCC BAA-1072 / DSM 3721 / NBRC 107634 / OCM 161 / Z-7303) TaxID=644295 RepID=D7EAB2_METEZ|nr:methylamine methyltransferase corrinoid protein reductive activase [Methanohalobium evestigatum]ADI74783.1 4Fe-4S ferredoxin iron-sulfur binding domain protein [Methanohalobium evestigatum Z-7303]